LYYETFYTNSFDEMCLERNMTITNKTEYWTISSLPNYTLGTITMKDPNIILLKVDLLKQFKDLTT